MDFILDPSLVLYLPLYELDGVSFVSKDTYGHLCTVTGALWRPAGRYFDGTDDKVVMSSIIPTGTTAITIETWTYLEATGTSRHLVKDTGWAAANSWLFEVLSNDKVSWAIRNDAGNDNDFLLQVGAIAAERWYHLVATYDSLGDAKPRIYMDLNENVGIAVGSPNSFGTSNDTSIGQDGASTWFGRVGELRIYNRALTLLEIQHNNLATKWRYR